MMKKRILYVEDDASLAYLTIDNLEQHFEVVHTNNGREAFEYFCSQPFDLCLLDIMLPEMDGFEIASEIRRRNAEVPIIFLSAKTMKDDRIKGLKLGADDYMTKPYSIEELILKIGIFLNRNRKTVDKTPKYYTIGSFLFDPENYSVKSGNGKAVTLTVRENAVMLLLVENANLVVKREVILNTIWGNDDYFSSRSLDVYITRLRKILKDEEKVRIETLPRVGFKLFMEN